MTPSERLVARLREDPEFAKVLRARLPEDVTTASTGSSRAQRATGAWTWRLCNQRYQADRSRARLVADDGTYLWVGSIHPVRALLKSTHLHYIVEWGEVSIYPG